VITIYVAIAGCCAEDEANAGGGGSPPSGLTPPSSIYLALSNVWRLLAVIYWSSL
jgi:hypothetical protein